MTLVDIRVADLVEDLDLYPRTDVSSVHVSTLAAAIESGAALPPPVADRKSKRLTDGFHRRRAYLKVLGPDAVIQVRLEDYTSEAEMYRAAVAYNVTHGLPLQSFEKQKIALRLRDAGEDDESIAAVLQMTPARIEKICLRVATVTQDNGSIRYEPLKNPLKHFQGQQMTREQAVAQKSAPGTSYLLVIKQVRDAVRHNLINDSDGRVIDELRGLAGDLAMYLSDVEVSA